MKISLKWLSEYVKVDEFFSKPQELADLLTNSGLEVDAVTNLKELYEHIVVGHVTELGKHPDADRLTVCQVNIGDKTLRQIVCGAKNHKQGDKVVVTLPGAVLPGNFEIKNSKIRGVESFGMMASESELGLSEESEGILILPADAPAGTSFAEYQGLDDVIFEVSVTPNRADCMSHLGLAREVACLLDRKWEGPNTKLKASGGSSKSFIQLNLKNSELCPRYAGRAIFGVKVGPSPSWLKSRLEAVDMNSVNNIVDVTNYVMLEMGQPLHAFDADEVSDKKIVVENSNMGETFTTLDGTEIQLTGEELTIRDGSRAVALAGVVGGKNSGVTEKTKDIFLEAAFFNNGGVRHTSRRFGIETDSAQRFARGTDPEGVLAAMNRACELIQQVAGGDIAKDYWDEYPKPFKHAVITVSLDYVQQRLGYSVEAADFKNWLLRLGCDVKEKKGVFQVQPPAYRWDLFFDVDLVEEYARLHGYENIPEKMPALTSEPTSHAKSFQNENRMCDLLVREGFHQAVNYRFLNQEFQKQFLGDVSLLAQVGLSSVGDIIKVKNPLSEDLGVMRESLLPGLFQNAIHNYRHGKEFGRQFELDYIFGKNSKNEYAQSSRLSMIGWGQNPSVWNQKTERPVVYDLKASLERTCRRLNIKNIDWRAIAKEKVPEFLHPMQCAGAFIEGRLLGVVGSLHPALLAEHKIRHSMAVCDIDFEGLMRGQPRVVQSKSISKFPSVERDLAVVIPKNLQVSKVIQVIQKSGAPFVHSVEVFDVFQGGNLKDEERSVSFKMLCQKMDGTFSDDELKSLQAKVIQSLESKLKLSLR